MTLEELTKSCRLTPIGKSAGPDNIPSDVAHIPQISQLLLPIMNGILNGEDPPDEWRKSIIIAIPKKGNSTLLTNQRGLSLMSVNAKLFNRVLLSRLRDRLEGLILPLQAGFRPERSTTEQILSLRLIIDACKTRKKNAILIFIDFSKAFDCVDRSALQTILFYYGVPHSFVNAIMPLYTNTSAWITND